MVRFGIKTTYYINPPQLQPPAERTTCFWVITTSPSYSSNYRILRRKLKFSVLNSSKVSEFWDSYKKYKNIKTN